MDFAQKIVVEGPDSKDKDAVIQWLIRKGWNHHTAPFTPGGAPEGFWSSSHISESVNTQFWFGRNRFTPQEKKKLDAELKANAHVLFVMANELVFPGQWGYWASKVDTVKRLNLMYWLELQDVGCITCWDPSPPALEEILRQLDGRKRPRT